MAQLSLLEMEQELDTTAIIAIFLFLGILSCSIFLWISTLNTPGKRTEPASLVPPWSIGWVDFALFICALIVSIFITQFSAVQLIDFFSDPATDAIATNGSIAHEEPTHSNDSEITSEEEPIEPTPWIAVLSILLLQIPMIVTFYGLRAIYPNIFGGSLNQKSVSLSRAILLTTPYFIRCFSIIWLTGLIWLGLLTGLQKTGLLDEFPPQQLVTLLKGGGDPFAVSLLALFAVLLAPFVEEIIFRGAIYRFLKGHIPIFNAQLVSGIFFACMHFNLMSFLPLIVIGIFLARLYEKEGNILLPMIFHAYWNGFSLLFLFLTSHSEVSFTP